MHLLYTHWDLCSEKAWDKFGSQAGQACQKVFYEWAYHVFWLVNRKKVIFIQLAVFPTIIRSRNMWKFRKQDHDRKETRCEMDGNVFEKRKWRRAKGAKGLCSYYTHTEIYALKRREINSVHKLVKRVAFFYEWAKRYVHSVSAYHVFWLVNRKKVIFIQLAVFLLLKKS